MGLTNQNRWNGVNRSTMEVWEEQEGVEQVLLLSTCGLWLAC